MSALPYILIMPCPSNPLVSDLIAEIKKQGPGDVSLERANPRPTSV